MMSALNPNLLIAGPMSGDEAEKYLTIRSLAERIIELETALATAIAELELSSPDCDETNVAKIVLDRRIK